MNDFFDGSAAPSRDHADRFYQLGLSLKSRQDTDAALTEFRRAVLADPAHQKAHLEIGLICKSRADRDPRFLRLAFEAFQKAARLDLNDEAAHTNYVLFAQKLRRLDEVHAEYDALVDQDPGNALLAQCQRNIVTISMAMMPQNVSSLGGDGAAKMRRLVFVLSAGLLLFGFVFLVGPAALSKGAKPVFKKDQVQGFMKVGVLLGGLGMAGFLVRARIR